MQCPVGSSTFRYGYQGGNPYYRKMMVANARVPVRNVQMWRDGKWNQLTRTIDNYWCALFGCWEAGTCAQNTYRVDSNRFASMRCQQCCERSSGKLIGRSAAASPSS